MDTSPPQRVNWGRRIDAAELRSTNSIDTLYEFAAGRGWVGQGGAGRLQFHTLVRFCVRTAKTNAGGLLTRLLAERAWRGSNDDEDQARRALAQLRRPQLDVGNLFAMPAQAAAAVPEDL